MKQVNYQQKNNYSTFKVETAQPLLEWLLQNLKGESRNKIKATLHGHGIKVNGKIRTQFNWPLQVGDRVAVSKSKQNEGFRSRYLRLVYEDMNQKFYAWLDEHCAEYGFIKRYPTRKLLLTGWDEPWHYRYVGVEAATFIMENNLCFEEFYAHYVPDFEY